MDADYRKTDEQPEIVGKCGGDRQYGTAGEVAFFEAIVGACADAELSFPAELWDLPQATGQWGQYATGIARCRSQY